MNSDKKYILYIKKVCKYRCKNTNFFDLIPLVNWIYGGQSSMGLMGKGLYLLKANSTKVNGYDPPLEMRHHW